MSEKTPEQIYATTPEVVKDLAQKVLKIERDFITQPHNQGLIDNLTLIFKEERKNEAN